jgi:hypothetical protein
MKTYETLIETINDLRLQGYTTDFNLKQHALECTSSKTTLSAEEFVVDKVIRFEGMTDPADESILYAITATDKSMKGLLVNAYGIYSDSISDELVKKLTTNQ